MIYSQQSFLMHGNPYYFKLLTPEEKVQYCLGRQFYSKQKYEDDIDIFIQEFSNIKAAETKYNLKIIVDLIERLSNSEIAYLIESVKFLSNFIKVFIFIYEK